MTTTGQDRVYGFIGLGQMGGPMAANIAAAGLTLYVHDKAGEALTPDGAVWAPSVAAVIAAADTVFMSVPDGPVSMAVAEEIAQANDRRATAVIDLSTIGPAAAKACAATLAPVDIAYIDAPVSGGRKGAIAGTIAVMCAGSREVFDSHGEVFQAFCKNPFHVGDEPGQGQALKMLNNFLSGTAMAATTEAILYGLSQGLEMKTMLDVVNVSTGQNTATSDKFPNRILTETFDAGFATKLLAKDVRLFRENVAEAGTPHAITDLVSELWDGCEEALPGSDFTRIFTYLGGDK